MSDARAFRVTRIAIVLSCVLTAMMRQVAAGDIESTATTVVEYSPYAIKQIPENVYFGDTHLHTAYSTDAGLTGDIRGPEEAYRLARGETITASAGLKARLSRPLDFLVVADHAENLGLAAALAESDPAVLETEWGKQIKVTLTEKGPLAAFGMWAMQILEKEDKLAETGMVQSYWQRSNQISEKYNEPGLFTALIGFEWTSMPGANNLHRNIIFRDGMDKTAQIIPMSSYDSDDPEDLWAWLEAYENKTGGRALAIPHNGNLSNGLMFDDVTLTSKQPIDGDYAQRRMRWEPLYEVSQIKGDAEAHPSLSPSDEFADFYTWDTGSLSQGPASKTQDMLQREYAREALKRGLVYEKTLGTNPFKFGLVGSTDSHTSIASTEEDNFFGKLTLAEPSADPRFRINSSMVAPGDPDVDKQIRTFQSAAGGLAAVWARENTRESLWDAMARKEVYATSGTRLRVRVFAGFEFRATDLERSDFAAYAYQHGVPMGGDLSSAPSGKAPTILIRALKDSTGANLDRIQLIKGWVDENGATHEKIYNVAVSDDRKPNKNGDYPPVGNTVDLDNATYTNAIGAPYLAAFWQDPDFDAKQNAFYYVRVLEIPTPNWLAFDAKIFGTTFPEKARLIHQERAYTTPIWYTP